VKDNSFTDNDSYPRLLIKFERSLKDPKSIQDMTTDSAKRTLGSNVYTQNPLIPDGTLPSPGTSSLVSPYDLRISGSTNSIVRNDSKNEQCFQLKLVSYTEIEERYHGIGKEENELGKGVSGTVFKVQLLYFFI
jgi:hypothetical protein